MTVSELLASKLKPKEKIVALRDLFKQNPQAITDLPKIYVTLKKDGDKGNCVAALTLLAEEDPYYLEPCITWIVGLLSAKQPRVKWEAAQIVAHVSDTFPEEAAKAIPQLLENAQHEGTVVRWSAAHALVRLAQSDPNIWAKLATFIEKMAVSDPQNGVRAIYAKALKNKIR